MKTIAIEINGVLRDFSTKFIKHYQEKFPERPIPESFNEFNLKKDFYFENRDEYVNFVNEFAYELYARTTTIGREYNIEFINFIAELRKNGYRIILINVDGTKSRSLTTFFVTNFVDNFPFDEIRFYLNIVEYQHENFDFIVSKNEDVLNLDFTNTFKIKSTSKPLDMLEEIIIHAEKD